MPAREFQLQPQPITSLAALGEGAQFAWVATDGALNLTDALSGKEVRKVRFGASRRSTRGSG
jgi:hypothetical protein